VSSFLTERDNILVEELCDSINVAFDEADRSEIEFDIGHAQPPRYIWEELPSVRTGSGTPRFSTDRR